MSILETLAERRLAEAARDGAFDRLPGSGQPLRLDADEGVPPEWWAAFHLLRNAGLAPEWIERRRAIEAALVAARTGARGGVGGEDWRARLGTEIEAINRQIDALNLTVPHPSLQRRRVRLELELEQLAGA
jgi:DnaJ family protein C protein 28